MKKTSKVKLCLTGVAATALSCCVIGAVAYAAVSRGNDEFVGEKYAPEITVNYGEFNENNVPDAVLNTPYKVFTATAEDLFSKEIYAHTRVWLFYDSVSRSLVELEDGYVTPTTYGVYTVEYSAIDRWGNETVALYNFECAEKEALQGDVEDDSTVYNAGDKIKVNAVEAKNAIGSVNVTAKAVLQGNESVSYEVVNGAFTPLYAGTYDVVYTLTDYNETGKTSYEVQVQAHSNPVWQSGLSLGTYYIAGCSYVLPEMKVLDFSDGTPKAAAVSIEVTDSTNATSTLGADRVFAPTLEGEYKIAYKTQVGEVTDKKEGVVNCVDVGFTGEMHMAEYFTSENVTKTINKDSLTLATTTDGAIVRFINPISSRSMKLNFSVVDTTADAFDSVDVILTSVEDPTQKISFNFAKNGTVGGILTASGGRAAKTAEGFYDKSVVALEYDNLTATAWAGNSTVLDVVTTMDGESFDGFDGENMFVEIRFNGVKGNSAINLIRIGNQVISNDLGDSIEPIIVCEKYAGGERKLGDIISLSRAYIYDVLSPFVETQYYVKDPSGKYVTSLDGVNLSPDVADWTREYQFKLEQYGRYTVYIKAIDVFGNEATFSSSIYVVSSQAVSIQLDCKASTTAKLGEKVKIDTFTVPGYDLSKLTVRTFVITPKEVTQEIKGGTFEAKNKGDYVVWYYVIDADGYMDMKHYTVTVS